MFCRGMKVRRVGIILCLWGTLLFPCGVLCAQNYHVYRPVPRSVKEPPGASRFPKLEPFIFGILSGSGLEDADGNRPVPVLYGGRAGISVILSPYITLSAEGTALTGSGNAGLFPVHMKKRGAAFIYKGTLSPSTEPQFYWLAGVGMMHTRASVGGVRMGNVDWKGLWWTAGAGVQWELFEPCRLTAEYRLNYEPSPSQSYVLTGVKWRHEFSAGFSWTF